MPYSLCEIGFGGFRCTVQYVADDAIATLYVT